MAGFSCSSKAVIGMVAIFALLFAIVSPAVVVEAQSLAPAPAPTSDGKLDNFCFC